MKSYNIYGIFVTKATLDVSKLMLFTNLYSKMNIMYLIIEKKQAVKKLLFSYVIEKSSFVFMSFSLLFLYFQNVNALDNFFSEIKCVSLQILCYKPPCCF